MAARRKGFKRWGIVVGIVGLALIVFGTVWMTAIFSRFEKIPADWDQIDELHGTFAFVDEPFLGRLQANRTLQQLRAAPGAGQLLADPTLLSLLQSPAVGLLVSDPSLLAVLLDPAALQVLTSPTLAQLLARPEVLGLLRDPAFLAALQDPAALPRLLQHPVAGPLLADPNVRSLLQSPAFLALVRSGALAALAQQPQVLQLLGQPPVQAALANPAVQALLADREALALLLDQRTQKVLANPADLPTVTVPVVLHRERRATGAEGNRLFINEQVATLDPATRKDVPGFEKTNVKLIVDRKSKAYLPGTEGGRSGYWGLPFHVKKDRVYPSWVTAAQRPLDAQYRGTEKLEGLETYLFVVDVTNRPLGANDPASGLPLVVDAKISTWNEPNSGSTVRIDDYDAVSALDAAGKKYPRFVADVKHTAEGVRELVADGKDNRNKIVWFGAYMPWMATGVGIVAALLGGALFAVAIRRRTSG